MREKKEDQKDSLIGAIIDVVDERYGERAHRSAVMLRGLVIGETPETLERRSLLLLTIDPLNAYSWSAYHNGQSMISICRVEETGSSLYHITMPSVGSQQIEVIS